MAFEAGVGRMAFEAGGCMVMPRAGAHVGEVVGSAG